MQTKDNRPLIQEILDKLKQVSLFHCPDCGAGNAGMFNVHHKKCELMKLIKKVKDYADCYSHQ